MSTSRITEGGKSQFKVTIMEISVCFGWAVNPYILDFRFCLAVVTVL